MGLKEGLPFLAVIFVECLQVGCLIVISKVAINSFIFVLYSNVLASLVLLPSCLLLFTRSRMPPLTFPIIAEMFFLAVLGFLAQNFQYIGVKLSSPTLGSALLNITPAVTFVFAIVFRMEKFNSGSSATIAKSIGTIVMIAGAFAITYYKGPLLLKQPSSNSSHQLLSQESNWILGGFLFVAECVLSSAWYIFQASILKKYPAELIVVFFYSVFISIQSLPVCLVLERNPVAWSLMPSINLMAVLYSGIFVSVIRIAVFSWCIRKKGPVFVCLFKPLEIVIAAAVGIIWSGDSLFVGSLLGAIVIVFGFYLVIWGKAKEDKTGGDALSMTFASNSQKLPLLQEGRDQILAFTLRHI